MARASQYQWDDAEVTGDSLINNFRSQLLSATTNNTSCGYFNSTGHEIISSGFEGIPDTLALNIIGWLILLLLFAILRKRAWNYGRIALVQKTEERWTQLFYGASEEVVMGASEADSVNSVDSNIDAGFCSWITAIFRTKDDSILQKCGPDAVQYLSFQRHIIFYMAIVMLISLALVLPINFQGNQDEQDNSFGRTTLHNLEPNSPYLWLHVTLAILYLPLGIIIMRRFTMTMNMKYEDSDEIVCRTLMITHIPVKHCDTADLLRHFREAYPEVEVQDLQLAYDIAKLSVLDKKREGVYQAKIYCENYFKDHGQRLEMIPYVCGNLCVCCSRCGCVAVDAMKYYAEEESRLRDEVENERMVSLKRPLGIAFVTFNSISAARKVRNDHQGSYKCLNNPPSSSLANQLSPHKWHVKFAPSPKDLYWEHLKQDAPCWNFRAIIINMVLFIVLFFFTTPALAVNLLDNILAAIHADQLQKMSPLLSEFLPTLLLLAVAAIMPALVAYSERWIPHRTRSGQNHAVMRKTLTLLLFMVLILPSLGLTSAEAFIRWTLEGENGTFRWDCLFLPDKGALFVNYVTTSAFIGTGLELIRFPELLVYSIQLGLARSIAERANVKKSIVYEFPFGVQYAWMLLIFAMTTAYSLSCPLITPVGLLYVVLKHLVDRHNIYFAYAPSKISSRIHATAINAVLVSIIFVQLSFTALAILRQGFNDIAIFSFTGLCISFVFLFAIMLFESCKGFSPFALRNRTHSIMSTASSPSRSNVPQFVPPVLQTSGTSQHSNMVSVQSPAEGLSVLQRTYGTHTEADLSPDAVLAFEPPARSTREHIVLYQDYDGSNAEV